MALRGIPLVICALLAFSAFAKDNLRHMYAKPIKNWPTAETADGQPATALAPLKPKAPLATAQQIALGKMLLRKGRADTNCHIKHRDGSRNQRTPKLSIVTS